jgi:hypothetical protein
MAHTLPSEVATIIRPWGLLTVIALGYAAYTLQPEQITRSAPRFTSPAAQLRAPLPAIPRSVVKCVQDGTVTYSDRPCDTLFDVLLFP